MTAAVPEVSEERSSLGLPPALQPYEARLSPERSLARVDGLLQLVTEPHPLQDRVDLALAARDLAALLNDAERQAGANFHLAHLLDSAEGLAAARLAASQYEHLRDPGRERRSLYRGAPPSPPSCSPPWPRAFPSPLCLGWPRPPRPMTRPLSPAR